VTPKRVQRERTKGWRMPDGAIYVGRPSRWGNRHRLGDTYSFTSEMAASIEASGDVWVWMRGRLIVSQRDLVEAYRQDRGLSEESEIEEQLRPLRGHDLACWCPLDQPCHADVLLELANS
jgi:hypothetical protein